MQSSLGIITAGLSIVASVAAPILWVGGIKETQASQQTSIVSLVKFQDTTESDIKALNHKVDLLLLKNGIDPAVILSTSNGQ